MYIVENEIVLREFLEKDVANKVEWINNFENNTYLHYDIPLTYEKTLAWYKGKDNEKRRDLVIEYLGIPVGIIGLLCIDNVNSKAEFYISMGNTSFKRKGIATKATKMLLKHAFEDLNLNKVYLNVDEENEIACRLYEKVGFKCEGVFIKDLFHRGKYINRKRYAILHNEFLG
ncbi:MAG: GNAT family N-acetyltransferase [Clostridia bacterium]|nr:GNAT family N-acetyltransferase [Clostridia bacterium]